MTSPTDSFLSTNGRGYTRLIRETYVSIDLWFDNKKIIIRAVLNDNRAYTAYTIHRSVLISHSTRNVFRDLFDGPRAVFDIASD